MATAERHTTPRTAMMLDTLRAVFDSDREVARALGVDAAQVSRWRNGQAPSDAAWDRLVDLFAVVTKLEGYYTPRRVRKWLDGPNAHLGDRTPLFLLGLGRAAEVIGAIQATKSGAFA
ncbi:MAG: hypothetical protein ACRELX_14280 [Longimicrobiales bacterium]